MVQLSEPPIQPPFLPGCTSRAMTLTGGPPAVRLRTSMGRVSSIASGVPPGRSGPAAGPDPSRDSSDRSHDPDRETCGDPARAAAFRIVVAGAAAASAGAVGTEAAGAGPVTGLAAARIRAATCLQLYPTGQLHWPCTNSSEYSSPNEKNASVE